MASPPMRAGATYGSAESASSQRIRTSIPRVEERSCGNPGSSTIACNVRSPSKLGSGGMRKPSDPTPPASVANGSATPNG